MFTEKERGLDCTRDSHEERSTKGHKGAVQKKTHGFAWGKSTRGRQEVRAA